MVADACLVVIATFNGRNDENSAVQGLQSAFLLPCLFIFSHEGGFIPPTIMPSSLDEAKAAYALVSSRGVYTDMTAFMERMLVKTYGEIEKDV